MILQRLASAIRRQDWFQVTIEILIVIVGIFLGLQVQQWNEGRAESIEEQNYLERLSAELSETIEFNRIIIDDLRNNHVSLSKGIRSLLDGNLSEQTMPEFENNFYASSMFPHPIIQSSVINEMLSTGKVAIISNIQIRNALVRYNGAIAGEQVNINGQFNEFLTTRRTLLETIMIGPDYFTTKEILDAPSQLVNNRELIGKLAFISEFETKQLEQLDEFQKATIDFENLLTDYLKNRD